MPHTIIAPMPGVSKQGGEAGSDPAFDGKREHLHRQMLSSVSHDLKTPLVSIIGSLDVLDRMKDKLPEDKQIALVRVALEEAHRLDRFITDILDMAKFENGMVQAKREDAEIGTLIRDCLTRMDARLRGSTVLVDARKVVAARTDTSLLCRAVCLVLENAVMHGGLSPLIKIDYGATENDQGFIVICDSSEGIPENQQDDLFSKHAEYAKGDRRTKGTGLGLAICKAVMDMLDGQVTASNHADGGAQFTLHFPLG